MYGVCDCSNDKYFENDMCDWFDNFESARKAALEMLQGEDVDRVEIVELISDEDDEVGYFDFDEKYVITVDEDGNTEEYDGGERVWLD